MKKGGDNDGEIVADGLGFDGDVDEDVIIGLSEVDRGQCGDNATYVLYNNGLLEISGTGTVTRGNWTVSEVKSVLMSEGITALTAKLFYDPLHTNLRSAILPSTLSGTGSETFKNVGLTSVVIPEGVTSIGWRSFRQCNYLTSVTLPSTITSISNGGFQQCAKLASMTVLATEPPTLGGADALPSTTVLQTIYVPYDSVEAYKTAWPSYASQIQPIPEVIETGACGTDATYELWSTGLLEISGTGEISDSTHYQNAFQGRTDISSVVIHTGITIIGTQAFYECSNIASVDIPEGVTKIDTNAFRGCIRMTSVTIPSTVTNVGYGAFCDWTFQSLLETVTVLAETPPVALAQSDLFAGCMRLTAICVPAASVDTYKAASGWSSYASKIQAIPSGD